MGNANSTVAEERAILASIQESEHFQLQKTKSKRHLNKINIDAAMIAAMNGDDGKALKKIAKYHELSTSGHTRMSASGHTRRSSGGSQEVLKPQVDTPEREVPRQISFRNNKKSLDSRSNHSTSSRRRR